MKRIQISRRTRRTALWVLLCSALSAGYMNCSGGFKNNIASLANSASSSLGGGSQQPPTTMPPTPPTPTQMARYQFTCTPGVVPSASQMQRLSQREYQNTIRDLVSQISPALYDSTIQADIASLPDDQTQSKINNVIVGETENTVLVYQAHINGYFQTAYDIAQKIAANPTYVQAIPGTNGCLTASTITSSCITNFITGFGLQVFRRPLTSTEVTTYTGYFNSADFSNNSQKITGVIAIFLQSPDFLYRIYDQGSAATDVANARVLTDYEFAEKLSYLITGSMPDATLFTKAGNGTLQTAAGVTTEVNRLLALPSARPALTRFFREWLQYDILPDASTYPADVTNGVATTNLSAAMLNDVDRSLQSVIFDYNGAYKDLMSTRIGYVADPGLAQIYGITNPNALVTLDTTRTGIFSRVAFLAKQAQEITSPVKRGRFILTSVLCKAIGNPPPNAPAVPPSLPAGSFFTTRDRFQYLTVQDINGNTVVGCSSCHGHMNPLGYTYESFDPIGRVRSFEAVSNTDSTGAVVTKNLPINTSSVTNDLDVPNIALASYQDLHQYLGNSDEAMACMSQQWFTFLEKRAPATTTSNVDGCAMNEFLNAAYGTATATSSSGQGSIQDVIRKTILSNHFRYWFQ